MTTIQLRGLTSSQKKALKFLSNYNGDEEGWISLPRNIARTTLKALEEKQLLEMAARGHGGHYSKIRLTDDGRSVADRIRG